MWQLFMWKNQGEIVLVGHYDSKEECSALAKEMKQRAGYELYFTWSPVGIR